MLAALFVMKQERGVVGGAEYVSSRKKLKSYTVPEHELSFGFSTVALYSQMKRIFYIFEMKTVCVAQLATESYSFDFSN